MTSPTTRAMNMQRARSGGGSASRGSGAGRFVVYPVSLDDRPVHLPDDPGVNRSEWILERQRGLARGDVVDHFPRPDAHAVDRDERFTDALASCRERLNPLERDRGQRILL